MHISWWMIEHFDKDFQRGTHFFELLPNLGDRRDQAAAV
jgi:hypothetical protein